MFLKQYNYKPRTGSQSSEGAAGSAQAQTQTQTQTATAATTKSKDPGPSQSATQAGRRRSSTDQKFAGLQGYKRSSMDDKRSSYADQSAGSGVLGQMWTNFTKGK